MVEVAEALEALELIHQMDHHQVRVVLVKHTQLVMEHHQSLTQLEVKVVDNHQHKTKVLVILVMVVTEQMIVVVDTMAVKVLLL